MASIVQSITKTPIGDTLYNGISSVVSHIGYGVSSIINPNGGFKAVITHIPSKACSFVATQIPIFAASIYLGRVAYKSPNKRTKILAGIGSTMLAVYGIFEFLKFRNILSCTGSEFSCKTYPLSSWISPNGCAEKVAQAYSSCSIR